MNKGMKRYIAIVSVLTGMVLLLILYALMNTQLRVVGKDVLVFGSTEKPNVFAGYDQALGEGSFTGTVFERAALDETVAMVVYDLRFANRCLVPAEMVEIQLGARDGDICYIQSESGQQRIDPFGTGDYRVTLFTKDGGRKTREMYITYYLWGNEQSMKFVLEENTPK